MMAAGPCFFYGAVYGFVGGRGSDGVIFVRITIERLFGFAIDFSNDGWYYIGTTKANICSIMKGDKL